MSIQSSHDFLTTAGQTPALAEGLVKAVGEKQGEPAIAAVAAYAQGHGYDVTVEDAWTAHQGFKRALEQNGELSDEDLAEVSGGAVVEITILGVVAIGAVIAAAGVAGAAGVVLGSSPEIGKGVQDFLNKW